MATVLDRVESNRRVSHPLQRLRSYIRFYVTAEGVGVLLLYLILWFWIGLLLDYGFFKGFWLASLTGFESLQFSIDWVQVLPFGFRAGVLAILVAGLVAVVVLKVVRRLFREFRASALALVLERRFPQVLGERLITAVELADPELAARYDFSQPMIDQTIQEAVERVDQLAVQEVFDWRRLRRLWLTVLLYGAGVYLAVLAVYAVVNREAAGFFGRFNDVASIWFERNILLHDTIWPRRAYLELVGFPGEEMRIGRDAAPPTLRVRALKWVIADADRQKAPEGWRALTWADLTPELLGEPVPQDLLPAAWAGWTVDQIEMQLEKPDVVGNLPGENTVPGLRRVLDQLHERAASRALSRRLRELVIPAHVVVYFKGATTRSEQTMTPGAEHEYTATVSSLKESLRFTVHGEDYDTPSRLITVVPPPNVVELTVHEAQPAYLYHAVPVDGTVNDLRGKKQHFPPRPISLTGDKSIIQVPAGTDVVIAARTDKPLRNADGVRLTAAKGVVPAVPVQRTGEQTFELHLKNVSALLDFNFEFTDTDNVGNKRHVEVKPTPDTPPEVEVQVEVMRKVKDAYMITPMARVPFSGKIHDDRGLAAVEYAYTHELVEANAGAAARLAVAGMAGASSGGIWPGLGGVALLGLAQPQQKKTEQKPSKTALTSVDKLLREQAARAPTVTRLNELLAVPPQGTLLKDVELDPDMEFFDVAKLGLKINDEKAVQPQYRMHLWVIATDNNIETGPRTGLSKEKFTFLIVSENELLAEIAKEEEGLHLKLEEALNRLKDSQIKLDKITKEMPELKKEEFSPMVRRAEEIEEAANKSWDTSREVLADYRRILKELRANQVQTGMISKVSDKICEPLDIAINSDFVQSDEAMRDFHKKLEAATSDAKAAEAAKQRLQQVITRLSDVLSAMGDVTTINKLITALVQIEKREREEYDRLKDLLRKKEEDLLGPLDTPPKPKEKK